MYAILVIELGYEPDYVLHKMKMHEVNIAMKYRYLKHKQSWEQARHIAYQIALGQVKNPKDLNLTDILCFQWDKKQGEVGELSEQQLKEINDLKEWVKNRYKNE